MKHRIKEPFTKDKFSGLRVGDSVLLTGTIYAARDAAHKRLVGMIEEGQELPIEIKDQIIYYAGPTPARPGHPIGSAGPTTSYRMDSFTPQLLKLGLSGMIGKGPRNDEVKQAAAECGAVYFAAIGGAAALISQSIKEAEVVAFAELGTESIHRLYVEDMPLIVACDAAGGDIFDRK